MQDQPFCGFELFVADGFTAAPWPVKQIKYYLDTSGYRGNLTQTSIRDVLGKAWGAWADVIDIQPTPVNSSNGAHVVMRFGAIDGPSKVLAWSHLSDGTLSQKQQLYDAGEAWETQISLLAVGCHEIGHVLGLDHDAANAKALMRPTYDAAVKYPQSRDVSRMIALGYQPAPIVPPTPPPTVPPSGKPVVISGWTGTLQVVNLSLNGLTRVDIDPGDLPISPLTAGPAALVSIGE